MSLRAAAAALGVTHVFLGQCERGRSPLPERLLPCLGRVLPQFDAEHYRLLVQRSKPVRIEMQNKRPEVQRAVVALSRLAEDNYIDDELLLALERAVKAKGPVQ